MLQWPFFVWTNLCVGVIKCCKFRFFKNWLSSLNFIDTSYNSWQLNKVIDGCLFPMGIFVDWFLFLYNLLSEFV